MKLTSDPSKVRISSEEDIFEYEKSALTDCAHCGRPNCDDELRPCPICRQLICRDISFCNRPCDAATPEQKFYFEENWSYDPN